MTGTELAQIYEFSYEAIQRNLDGLTNDDSVLCPEPAGNCVNWVVGHMVTRRGLVLMVAGADGSVLTDDEAARTGGVRRRSAKEAARSTAPG
jgi:hypothetical protein